MACHRQQHRTTKEDTTVHEGLPMDDFNSLTKIFDNIDMGEVMNGDKTMQMENSTKKLKDHYQQIENSKTQRRIKIIIKIGNKVLRRYASLTHGNTGDDTTGHELNEEGFPFTPMDDFTSFTYEPTTNDLSQGVNKMTLEMKMENSRRKLHDQYQQIENAKSRRSIKILELHQLPMNKLGPKHQIKKKTTSFISKYPKLLKRS